MKKRKRSEIKKAKVAILKEANRLQHSGIDVSRRAIVVGGTKPISVQAEWDLQNKKVGKCNHA